MIVTRTPYRISLLGGSCDYPVYYRKHSAIVVGGAINLFSYISVRKLPPYHDYISRFSYSEIETVTDNLQVRHNAIRETLKYLGLHRLGVEVFHCGDLPSKSGIGSSSSFVVGLLNALATLDGHHLTSARLAKDAIHIEQTLMGEIVGCQDQTFAAYGGLNQLKFHKNGEVSVFPLALDDGHIKELESHLLLLFTKIQRRSSEVASSYAHLLGDSSHLAGQHALQRLTEDGLHAIYAHDYVKLGDCIDQSWRIKSKQSEKVSSPEIQGLYNKARILGCLGGKLVGGGGGGCLLLVVPPNKRQVIIEGLEADGCVHIDFKFEFDGSRVVFAS